MFIGIYLIDVGKKIANEYLIMRIKINDFFDI